MTREERILGHVAAAFWRSPENGVLVSNPRRVQIEMEKLVQEIQDCERKPSLTYISPLRSRAA